MGRKLGECGAIAPDIEVDGKAVQCGREPDHDVGQYDRHKAVYPPAENPGKPHRAVIWNEPEPDRGAEG